MEVKYSDQLDAAFRAACSRNSDAANKLVASWAGDGINECDFAGEIVTAARKHPNNTPLFATDDGDGSVVAFLFGKEAELIRKLNAI